MPHHGSGHVPGRELVKCGGRLDERQEDNAADPDDEAEEHEEAEKGHGKEL